MITMLFMYLKAFAVGGTICMIAQLLINYTKITSGKILVYFLLAGVALQSVGLYQYLVDFAGEVRPFPSADSDICSVTARSAAQNTGFSAHLRAGLPRRPP